MGKFIRIHHRAAQLRRVAAVGDRNADLICQKRRPDRLLKDFASGHHRIHECQLRFLSAGPVQEQADLFHGLAARGHADLEFRAGIRVGKQHRAAPQLRQIARGRRRCCLPGAGIRTGSRRLGILRLQIKEADRVAERRGLTALCQTADADGQSVVHIELNARIEDDAVCHAVAVRVDVEIAGGGAGGRAHLIVRVLFLRVHLHGDAAAGSVIGTAERNRKRIASGHFVDLIGHLRCRPHHGVAGEAARTGGVKDIHRGIGADLTEAGFLHRRIQDPAPVPDHGDIIAVGIHHITRCDRVRQCGVAAAEIAGAGALFAERIELVGQSGGLLRLVGKLPVQRRNKTCRLRKLCVLFTERHIGRQSCRIPEKVHAVQRSLLRCFRNSTRRIRCRGCRRLRKSRFVADRPRMRLVKRPDLGGRVHREPVGGSRYGRTRHSRHHRDRKRRSRKD